MKKTVSMLLAVIMAALAICTFSVFGFADEAENDDPVDTFVTTEKETEKATEKETEKATEKETEKATDPAEKESTSSNDGADSDASNDGADSDVPAVDDVVDGILGVLTTVNIADILASEPVVTLPEGVTAIDDSDETTAAPATTKKAPAKNESSIPNTGSTIVVPAIALLALAAGTVAVVKTKKED